MASFSTGALRTDSTDKPDYEGYLSPLAMEAFGQYMTKHRKLPDGTLRASDNWQLGIPDESYMKSLWRHMVTLWKCHRRYKCDETMEDSLCAIIFNAQGRLHTLKTAQLSLSKAQQPWERKEQMDPIPISDLMHRES